MKVKVLQQYNKRLKMCFRSYTWWIPKLTYSSQDGFFSGKSVSVSALLDGFLLKWQHKNSLFRYCQRHMSKSLMGNKTQHPWSGLVHHRHRHSSLHHIAINITITHHHHFKLQLRDYDLNYVLAYGWGPWLQLHNLAQLTSLMIKNTIKDISEQHSGLSVLNTRI